MVLDRKPVYVAQGEFETQRIGAAAIYCSDGRYGEQMDEFLHQSLGLPRYDRIAVPGGAGCLGDHTHAFTESASLERQLRFLIEAHDLRRIVLIAHHQCAFYGQVWLGTQTLKERQAADLERAATKLRMWYCDLEVEAYFANPVNNRVTFESWNAHSLSDQRFRPQQSIQIRR